MSPVAFEFPVSAASPAEAGAESLLAALRESERHYRHMVECNPQIPWTAGPMGKVDEISERWLHLTGLTREQAYADGWEAATHPEDLSVVRTAIDGSTARRLFSARFRVRTAEGDWRWMWSRARPRVENGEVIRWYGVLEDIHDQVLAEQALRDREERLRIAVRATGLGVWDYDVAADRGQWSDELKALLGLPVDAPVDRARYLSLVHPDDRAAVAERFRNGLRDKEVRNFANQYRILRGDTGEERWIATDGHIHPGPDGRPARVLMTVRDVTESRSSQERVLWAARHDPLTGLANRALFNERLARLVEERRGGPPFGLLLFDLDHLKQVNDTIGHDGGDAVLKKAAERLVAAVTRPEDVARLGGDEFGVVVRDVVDADGLAGIAERLRIALAAPVLVHGRVLDGHASIGAALFPDHGRKPSDLLKSADLALYAAKTGGRGRAQLFERRMRAGMVRRAGQLARAHDALRDGRVEPHYQPKIDLATGRVAGFEALLRWTDAHGRPRRPADLQAAFEDYELAAELSERMLARVVADMAAWRAAGLPFGSVAVNVSNAEFARGDLTRRVLDRLAAAGLSTGHLELELTETVLLGQRAQEVEETLTALSMAGVRLALDDFGTGFASLVHLKRFPIDVIKIDRSFTAGVGADPGAAAIVRALIGLSRDLGMETVAEGVETSEQFRWLQHEGCILGQGYLFGRAQPAALVPSMLG